MLRENDTLTPKERAQVADLEAALSRRKGDSEREFRALSEAASLGRGTPHGVLQELEMTRVRLQRGELVDCDAPILAALEVEGPELAQLIGYIATNHGRALKPETLERVDAWAQDRRLGATRGAVLRHLGRHAESADVLRSCLERSEDAFERLTFAHQLLATLGSSEPIDHEELGRRADEFERLCVAHEDAGVLSDLATDTEGLQRVMPSASGEAWRHALRALQCRNCCAR
ncbi:MAG: hypothetical protein R3F43_09940 [bacterium]